MPLAGIEVERHSLHVADDRLRRGRRRRVDRGGGDPWPAHWIESAIRFVAIPTPSVVEQLPNGDLLPPRIDRRPRCRRKVRDERRHAIVERELALFDQL